MLIFALHLIAFLCLPINAATYVLPENGRIVGTMQQTNAGLNETIEEVGLRFGIGYKEMVQANPAIDPLHILAPHKRLIIPSEFQLPSGPRTGIVIELSKYRLFFYPPGENVVVTFPVGIGKKGWETPVGITKIVAKTAHPTWRPTSNILKAAENNGTALPYEFPAGPDNPLGDYALRLGWNSVLIHGSNQLTGIGAKVSAGCIRMLPDDIEYLFQNVSIGTRVRVL